MPGIPEKYQILMRTCNGVGPSSGCGGKVLIVQKHDGFASLVHLCHGGQTLPPITEDGSPMGGQLGVMDSRWLSCLGPNLSPRVSCESGSLPTVASARWSHPNSGDVKSLIFRPSLVASILHHFPIFGNTKILGPKPIPCTRS